MGGIPSVKRTVFGAGSGQAGRKFRNGFVYYVVDYLWRAYASPGIYGIGLRTDGGANATCSLG